MKLLAATIVVILLSCGSSWSQGFKNLNFELAGANVQQNQTPGPVNASLALPFWSAFLGPIQQTQIQFNNPSLGSSAVNLYGTNAPAFTTSIEGGFSAFLQGGGVATNASIRQTGLVPVDAQSILFKAQAIQFTPGPLFVSLGGQNIPLFIVSTGPNYKVYGGDVSGFANQTMELQFLVPGGSTVPETDWNIDSIIFSPQPIPEPGVLTMLIAGGSLLTLRRQRKLS